MVSARSVTAMSSPVKLTIPWKRIAASAPGVRTVFGQVWAKLHRLLVMLGVSFSAVSPLSCLPSPEDENEGMIVEVAVHI